MRKEWNARRKKEKKVIKHKEVDYGTKNEKKADKQKMEKKVDQATSFQTCGNRKEKRKDVAYISLKKKNERTYWKNNEQER